MKSKIKLKTMNSLRTPKKSLLAMAVSAAVSIAAAPGAYALSFSPSDEVDIDWDTVVSYGAAWRVESHDEDLLSDINADDGNRNFDQGLISNRAGFLTEANISYRDYGAFVRASGFYDDVYFDENDNDSPSTHNSRSVANNQFTKDTEDHNGQRVRLLDAFVYGNFDVSGRNLNLRVGRQVVSWGESLFIPGMSASQSPADGTKANVPGVEVKEILLPVGQVFGQLDLTDNLSMAAYSQWEWQKTEFDAVGSYFSTSDLLDEGGEARLAEVAPGVIVPVLTRTHNEKPSDSGQWGVAFNYLAEELNDTEFGLYYINYHDKQPSLVVDDFVAVGPAFVPTTYHLEYFEDIQLVGLSFGTVLGDTNVGGEIAYRDGAPVLNAVGSPVEAETLQAQVSAIHVFGPTPFSDDLTLTGEIGYNQVLDHDKEDLLGDKNGWGMGGMATLKYFDVIPSSTLEVPISFSYNGRGNSGAGTFTRTANADKVSVGAKVIYQENWQAELKYTAFLGNAEDNARADRDFVSFNVKYSF